jgi:hypothetical protein
MGFGVGMGIGWAVTGNAPTVQGYFNILSDCNGKVFKTNSTFSQQLLSNDYSEGDYVDAPNYGSRVLLGAFFEVLPPEFNDELEISGQAYDNC